MNTQVKQEETNVLLQTDLNLPSLSALSGELAPVYAAQDISDEVKASGDSWIEKVIAIDMSQIDMQHAASVELKTLGGELENELLEMSELLQTPMSELMADAENGGDVAKDLLKLEETARSIDPNGYDFENMSGVRAFLSKFGLMPTPLKMWIAKYQSTESIIKSIEKGLRQGKQKLERDNQTLKSDQIRYRQHLLKLDAYIQFARYVDETLDKKVAEVTDAEKKRFLTDEVLFPVRQRHQDLHTSKVVFQQAWVTSEFIIKTNEELIRGVDRALKHTLIALGVASSLAIALARQKKVLKALQSTKQITEKMITDIADQLLEQGTAVMAQASDPFLQVEVMKAAFTKTLQAMDEVSRYRSEALTQMKTSVSELQTMTSEIDSNIQRIERGQLAKEEFKVLLG
ncbi:toxic anion resistance protein [Marinomonas sp. THO17]|uniref:toxic anion resistance protein n=1 Tax=Marinomonas sp. THO17 TaxID=3149048 RepID=UPI00336C183A